MFASKYFQLYIYWLLLGTIWHQEIVSIFNIIRRVDVHFVTGSEHTDTQLNISSNFLPRVFRVDHGHPLVVNIMVGRGLVDILNIN